MLVECHSSAAHLLWLPASVGGGATWLELLGLSTWDWLELLQEQFLLASGHLERPTMAGTGGLILGTGGTVGFGGGTAVGIAVGAMVGTGTAVGAMVGLGVGAGTAVGTGTAVGNTTGI